MKNWNFINGWSLKIALVNGVYSLIFMNLLITTNPIQAEEADTLPMEFLEFLGEGIVIEDEYLDPLNYDDIDQVVTTEKSVDGESIEQTHEVKIDEE